MSREIRFSVSPPRADRVYHVSEDDIRVVLSRLPPEAKSRLRALRFNDTSSGAQRLGYVSPSRRKIAMTAPPAPREPRPVPREGRGSRLPAHGGHP